MSGPREFRLLGDPVAHSLSPAIHRAAFEAWGVDATYTLQRVGPDELERAVRDAADRGGGNVTLPHKRAVARLLDRGSPHVAATGACNCFWRTSEGSLAGDNTDVEGFLAAVRDLGADVSGGRALVLGAGGAARAALRGLQLLGARRIDVWNRTAERARRLVTELAGDLDVLERRPTEGRYDLVVNATRLGLDEADPLPLDLSGGLAETALDLVYGRHGTPWTRHADEHGVPAMDGTRMLVHQAALSLARWFPEREAPLDAMFAVVRWQADDASG